MLKCFKQFMILTAIISSSISALAISLPADSQQGRAKINAALRRANGAWTCTFRPVGAMPRKECGVSSLNGDQNYGLGGVFGWNRSMIANSQYAARVLEKPDDYQATAVSANTVLLQYKVYSGLQALRNPKASMGRKIEVTMNGDLSAIQKIQDTEILNDPSGELGATSMQGSYVCVPRVAACGM